MLTPATLGLLEGLTPAGPSSSPNGEAGPVALTSLRSLSVWTLGPTPDPLAIWVL